LPAFGAAYQRPKIPPNEGTSNNDKEFEMSTTNNTLDPLTRLPAPSHRESINNAVAVLAPLLGIGADSPEGHQLREHLTDTTRADEGWCDTRDDHDGRWDHLRRPSCGNFVADAEHTARLMADAIEQDQKTMHRFPSGATTPEAEYVTQYRPH
jgi:hypothetical protein